RAGLSDAEDPSLAHDQTHARSAGPLLARARGPGGEPLGAALDLPRGARQAMDQRVFLGDLMNLSRIPRHVSFIPDGNRRWAEARGMTRSEGYSHGIERGVELLRLCKEVGIEEVSIYGFTKENVRRPADQVEACRTACTQFAMQAIEAGAAVLAVGDADSAVFPPALLPWSKDRSDGDLRVNL